MSINYRTHTVTINETSITVRESLGIDQIDAVIIYESIDYDRSSRVQVNRAIAFAQSVLRTVSWENLPIPWYSVHASEKDLQDAFDHWVALDRDIFGVWQKALLTVNNPGDPKE